MNGKEQKARHGQIQALEAHFGEAMDETADRLDGLDKRLTEHENSLITRDQAAASAWEDAKKAIQEARDAAWDADAKVKNDLANQTAILKAGFWARLGWLLFGRLPVA